MEFAETAIKTARLTNASQQCKLEQAFCAGTLSKDEYDKQMHQLKHQFEIDRAPWEVYVKKLSQLIVQYSSKPEPQRNSKRTLNQCSSAKKTREQNVLFYLIKLYSFGLELSSSSATKRTRIEFSSSSSDSDVQEPESIPPPSQKKPDVTVIKYDSSTNTSPLELSLRSPFPSTPNNIPFTAQTNYITQRVPLQVNIILYYVFFNLIHMFYSYLSMSMK